ncbi:DUF4240 domain-containing protein [Streptomyces sp. NPDC001380]|uniref:DUF4240 domain-containing protein n=1 Tax=Streptomyces sp. NPDC001380 TaxID=3364566 RepID=UPI0036C9E549
MWAAASLIGGGCSDDRFSDFTAGLVALGQGWYERTAGCPDALADHPAVRAAAATGDHEAVFYEDFNRDVAERMGSTPYAVGRWRAGSVEHRVAGPGRHAQARRPSDGHRRAGRRADHRDAGADAEGRHTLFDAVDGPGDRAAAVDRVAGPAGVRPATAPRRGFQGVPGPAERGGPPRTWTCTWSWTTAPPAGPRPPRPGRWHTDGSTCTSPRPACPG